MNISLAQNKNKATDIEIIVVKNVKDLKNKIKKILLNLGFSTKNSEPLILNDICYIGVDSIKGEDLKIGLSNAIQKIKKTKFGQIYINIIQNSKEIKLDDIIEGLVLGSYTFDKYKSKRTPKNLEICIDISSSTRTKSELSDELEKNLNIVNSVNMVRDFVNTIPEDFYPETMAINAKNIANENNLACKVFGEDYLKTNNMNAMLAVGRASRHESKLIHLTYKPKNPKGKIVVVGKGLTYDCGGLSLKPSGGLSMKCDKSGGCAVLGIMNTISKLNCEYEVHGIIGAVENMIGGDAYKPDDVLVARNGKTIEVRNTDAEGRLVLADCLCYAQDEIKDIDYMFDMATLTGACIVGLGEYTTGVMGHSEKFKKKLMHSANQTGELVGVLPMNRYLMDKMNSKIADVTNAAGSRSGGAITASIFLDHFVEKENKNKWLHLDIAGAAYSEQSWGYNPYGATGAGVRLILNFISRLK
jgi:leucyl aminopeptidase